MTTSPPPYWDRLDPDARRAARAFAEVTTRPLRELGPEAARELLPTTPTGDHRMPVDRVEEMAVPTRSGPRRARLHHPTGPRTRSPRPALRYLHGGGFVLGGLEGVDPLRDDAEACAERMRDHDVPVTTIRYAGVIHGVVTEVGPCTRTDVAVTDVAGVLARGHRHGGPAADRPTDHRDRRDTPSTPPAPAGRDIPIAEPPEGSHHE